MKKTKIIGMIIGIIGFIAVIIGVTYAWFTWNSDNIKISGSSKCFIIDYEISQEIGAGEAASLKLSDSYEGGQYAALTMSLNSRCTDMKGRGTLYLNTNTVGTDTKILSGALKFAVVRRTGELMEVVKEGVITSTDRITLLENIDLNATTVSYSYEVWVWIDGNIADNEYYNTSYSGYISAEVDQIE